MFLGHYAVALGAKRLTPYSSLGTLVLAAVFLDLVWPTLLLAGLEAVRVAPGITAVTPLDFTRYPWSHSLLMAGVWTLVVGGVYGFFRRYPRGVGVLMAAVLSHWVLDVISHRPDLPLTPWTETRVGLGLWHSLPATVVVELLLFGIGLYLYAQHTEPVDRDGRRAMPLFALFLLAVYAASLLGPPPPSAAAVAWGGQAQWLLVVWAFWIDRHRVAIRQWR